MEVGSGRSNIALVKEPNIGFCVILKLSQTSLLLLLSQRTIHRSCPHGLVFTCISVFEGPSFSKIDLNGDSEREKMKERERERERE